MVKGPVDDFDTTLNNFRLIFVAICLLNVPLVAKWQTFPQLHTNSEIL